MFGITDAVEQNEDTPLRPQSPYACAKVYALMLTRYFRDVHTIFASTATFFNHESPRRTDSYVSRKITKAAARISLGLQNFTSAEGASGYEDPDESNSSGVHKNS